MAACPTVRRNVLAAVVAVSLVACAPSAPGDRLPSGDLDVLGPVPAFEASALPSDWIVEGTTDRGQMVVVERDGIPALMAVNGGREFLAAKPARAYLLATPYLSWAWNMEMPEHGPHPVRLIVGFRGGAPGPAPAKAAPPGAAALPAHDRAILIAWGESALRRGAIVKAVAAKDAPAAVTYTARGGRENAATWWLETVDLSDIYRRSWPEDDAAGVRIVFIGIAALGGLPPSPAYLSGIRLSR